MKILIFLLWATVLMSLVPNLNILWADDPELSEAEDFTALQSDTLFTPEELDELVAPIALYPDPLIAQILPAATFVDQIDEAARYVGQYGKASKIDDMSWDVSVKAVAHYPDVLFMMDRKYDWTVSLGQAYLEQEQEVMDAIQRLRVKAESAGTLASTTQQQVITEDDAVRILPAEPDVIYVPQYDPALAYDPGYGFLGFGVGYTIGVWLNRDCDWRRHHIYYHGWKGTGWIDRARPHVQVRNRVYVNRNYINVNKNRGVMQLDSNRFHEDLRIGIRSRRIRTVPTPGLREIRPGDRKDQTVAPRAPSVALPSPSQGSSATGVRIPSRSTVIDDRAVRGLEQKNIERSRARRDDKPSPPFTGYGGYGKSGDASVYRDRGQTSRGNMIRTPGSMPAVPNISPSPVQRNMNIQRQSIPQPSGSQVRPMMQTPSVEQQTPRSAPGVSDGYERRRRQ